MKKQCNRVYFLGDLHLSIGIQDKSMDKFPSFKGHMEKLTQNWNAVVNNDDIIIVCGDICWGKRLDDAIPSLDYLSKLNGYKIVFRGNHDYWFSGVEYLNTLYHNIYFVKNELIEINEKAYVLHKGYSVYGELEKSDKRLLNRESIRIQSGIDEAKRNGYDIENIVVAVHYNPLVKSILANDNYINDAKNTIFKTIANNKVKKCYYGHLHGNYGKKQQVNKIVKGVDLKCVSADLVNFTPQI